MSLWRGDVTRDEVAWADEAAMARDASRVPALIRMLDSADQDVVAAAADALGHIGPPALDAWRSLARLLARSDMEPWVRDTAAYALGQIGARDPVAIAALESAAGEDNTNVAQCAREALAVLSSTGGVT